MKKIGVISDTHGFLDEKVFKYFDQCDEVWHAGDIGTGELLDKLASFKPLRAVFGNIDGHEIRIRMEEDKIFHCEGLRVYMTHIAGTPGKYNMRVRNKIKEVKPGIMVCGHSHILRIASDKSFHNMLYINPGAAGIHGFHKVRTLVRLSVEDTRIFDVQVIELGARTEYAPQP
jgi:uncharacterized protein